MKKTKIVLTSSLVMGLVAAQPASAQSAEQVEAFLKSAACSRLPTGACDLLTPANAKNIMRAYQSQLSAAYCGSGNIVQARQFLKMGIATDPGKCAKLLSYIK